MKFPVRPIHILLIAGLIVADVSLSTYVLSGDTLLLILSSIITVVGMAMILLGSNIAYDSTTAGQVMQFAAKHGYRGPALRFSKKWKNAQQLKYGELTCLGEADIQASNAGACYIVLRSQAVHFHTGFSYFVWHAKDGTYQAAAMDVTGSSNMRPLADGVTLGEVLSVRFLGTLRGEPKCPHTTHQY